MGKFPWSDISGMSQRSGRVQGDFALRCPTETQIEVKGKGVSHLMLMFCAEGAGHWSLG